MQKCTKFDVGWGSVPNPAVGAFRASPDSVAEFKGKWRGGAKRQGIHLSKTFYSSIQLVLQERVLMHLPI